MKLIYCKSLKLSVKRSYVKMYNKNGKEIESVSNEEESNNSINNEILSTETNSTFTSNSSSLLPSSSSPSPSCDSNSSSDSNEESEIISIENDKSEIINNSLEMLINKYLNKENTNNIFNLENKDIVEIKQLFEGKNYPIIDINKPMKYILIILFFYIENKKSYIVDEKSKSLKSFEVLEYIITKYKSDPKSFYSNSWPICLIPFLPCYCNYIYNSCGMKLLSELFLLYNIINRNKNGLNNNVNDINKLIYNIRECIHSIDDYKILSSTVNNNELIELVCI